MTTGSALQSSIEHLLYLDGYLVLRINQGGATFGEDTPNPRYVRFAFWSMLGHEWQRPDGISDLLAIKADTTDGRLTVLAIEVKGDGDSIRPGQVDFLAAAGEAGMIPILAESTDDIQPFLSDRVMVQ